MTAKKSARQIDVEIAHSLAKRPPKKPRPEAVALFEYLADNAEAYGRENLSYARREEGYTGDPKEFRYSEIWAARLPDYKHTLLVDYIDEAYEKPHARLGRKLTQKEQEWMGREATKMFHDEMRFVREDLARRNT